MTWPLRAALRQDHAPKIQGRIRESRRFVCAGQWIGKRSVVWLTKFARPCSDSERPGQYLLGSVNEFRIIWSTASRSFWDRFAACAM